MDKTIVGRVLVIASALILCACVTKPPAIAPVQAAKKSATEQALNSPPTKETENSAFKNQQVMSPAEGIERDKLLVSYSMKVIPAETGNLVKISIIFRNMKDKRTYIRPKISLTDSKGALIRAYTKKGFLKLTSQDKAIGSANDKQRAASEKIAWANAYWLKDKFHIPPGGIEIGELIYHCTSLTFPMKLTVNSALQNFVFTISEPAQNVAGQAR